MTTNSDSPDNIQQPSLDGTTPAAASSDSAPTTPAADATAPLASSTVASSTDSPRRRRLSKRTLWIGGAVAGVLALGGAGIAIADELGEGSNVLDDATRERVAAAATAYTDGGDLIDAERDDDGGFEAEVRLDDGREVDLRLDDDYTVVSSDADRSGDDDTNDGGTDDDTNDDGTNGNGTNGDDDANGDDDGSGTTGDGSGTTDSDDVPLTADETDRATEAAISEAGGGEVVDVDRSDDRDHAFEVEVRREDGSEVEVHLDADFGVVSSTPSD